MAEEKWLFWVCNACPYADECKPDSFKRAKCWGETPEEARSALVRHLVYSSHHNFPEDEAEAIASKALVEQEDWTSAKPARSRLVSPSPKRRHAPTDKKGDDAKHKSSRTRRSRSPPQSQPSARRSRSPPPSAKASGSQMQPAPKKQAVAKIVNARIAEEGAGTVFVEVLEHCATLMADFKKPPPPQPATSASSVASVELVTSRFQHKSDIHMIPSEKVKHAIDALGRGITAATHAQRLALAAANSFSVEVEVLSDVKKTLESMMTGE